MTTPRTRRNKPQQARDILLTLLKDQEAAVDDLTRKVNMAVAERDRTKRTIELLDQPMLPGIVAKDFQPSKDSVPIPITVNSVPVGLSGGLLEQTVTEVMPYVVSDENVQGVNDVWDPKDGPITVHSSLMYERQERCELCKAGVPFATEKRTEHYVVSKDEAGVRRGFEYKPCTGIKERVFDVATKDFGKGDA